MTVRVIVAKETTPEQLGWRARIAANEGPVASGFLTWIAELQAQIQVEQITAALASRATSAFDHVLQAVAWRPQLVPAAAHEAEVTLDSLLKEIRPGLRMSFDLHDPNFTVAVERHQAALVREVTAETRRAIGNMIDRGYRQGWHPDVVAREIRAAVGLTARQAQAVLTFADAQAKRGVAPERVADRAMRYAGQLRTRRAKTIARTETARASVLGRLASYEQAADRGLFDRATAELEWSAVQQDPEEICGQLDGTRVPFGQSFDGLLPPAHPCCRCSVHLVLPRPATRPVLTLVR